MKIIPGTLLALGILSCSALAQGANYTVGPSVVPQGCRVSITLSNDNEQVLGILAPLFRVLDAQGTPVFESSGPLLAVTILPHGWFTFYWDQTDQSGAPVPPGDYSVEVRYDTFVQPTAFDITVVPEGAGLVFEGTATTKQPVSGGTRNFLLCSPNDAGMPYLLLGSLTSATGFATCGGVVPLDVDGLLLLTLTPGTLFQNSLGVLNEAGVSSSPRFDLPDIPQLVGLSVQAAFVVLDTTGSCPIRRISNAHSMTIR